MTAAYIMMFAPTCDAACGGREEGDMRRLPGMAGDEFAASLGRALQVQWQAAVLPGAPQVDPVRIVGLSWVVEMEALSIALCSGELLLLHTSSREVGA